MAGFMKGDVVVVPFPFSDLTQARRRPAFVIASLEGDDVILCQITSQSVRDQYAVPVDESDFETAIVYSLQIATLSCIRLVASERKKQKRSFQK